MVRFGVCVCVGGVLGPCQMCLDWDLVGPEVKGLSLDAHCMPGDLELPIAEVYSQRAPR